VRIGELEIKGGWIYVGETLAENPANSWSRRNAAGLIDPKLKVAISSGTPADLSAYPSYADLTPSQRGHFLQWLASDRADLSTPPGYIRLFLFGLEYRVVVEEPDDEELTALASEISRLAQVYGTQGGLQHSCERLAEGLEIKRLATHPAALAAWRPQADAPTRWGFSPALKLAIAHRVVTEEPLNFELAMAGYLGLPHEYEDETFWAARRTPHLIAALARGAFEKKYPQGFRLRDKKTSNLYTPYQTLNYQLSNPDWVRTKFGRLPDPQTLNWRGMKTLCTPVAEQLTPYARYLGTKRHPDSLEGLLLLPPEALEPQQKERLSTAAEELAALARPVGVAETAELGTRLIGSAEDWNLSKLRQLQAVVSGLGYAMEPDPTLAKVTAKAEPQVWVFEADAAEILPDARLELASVLFLALGYARGGEGELRTGLDPWVVCTADVLRVDAAHLPRLEARCRRLSRQAPTASRLARAVEPLGPEDKACLAEAAAAVAGRMVCQTQPMMLALEKLYDALGIERRALYADLHRRAAEGLAIVETASPSPGFAIPRPPSAIGVDPGALDMARIQSIVAETRAVSATLAAIYEDEGTSEPTAVFPAPAEACGLDAAHETLLGELAARDAWPAADLEALCRRSGLMAAAAVEVLNDWAYERCGEPVLEDEGEWRVNRDILEEARRAAA
jgi:hypothetical protein